MRSVIILAGIAAVLLLAAPAGAGTIEDAACAQAKDWTGKLRRHAGFGDHLEGWRCDVVEDLGDGTWRVAGMARQQGRTQQDPFVARLWGPVVGLFGYCEVSYGGRSFPQRGPASRCERPAPAEAGEADPPA